MGDTPITNSDSPLETGASPTVKENALLSNQQALKVRSERELVGDQNDY